MPHATLGPSLVRRLADHLFVAAREVGVVDVLQRQGELGQVGAGGVGVERRRGPLQPSAFDQPLGSQANVLDDLTLETARGQASVTSQVNDANDGIVFLGKATDAVDEAAAVIDASRERTKPARKQRRQGGNGRRLSEHGFYLGDWGIWHRAMATD